MQTAATLSVIVLYSVICLGIGWFISRKPEWQADKSQYFVGGRSFGWVVTFFTLMATQQSAFFFLGSTSTTYSMGAMVLFQWVYPFTAVWLWLVGSRLNILGRKYNHITPADLLGDYYNSSTIRLIVAAMCIVYVFPYLFTQIMAGGYILEGLTNGTVSYFWGITFFTVVMGVYCWAGGARGVAWTDVLQGAVFIVAGIVLSIWFVGKYFGGSMSQMFQQISSTSPHLLGLGGTLNNYLMFIFLWFGASFAMPFMPQVWNRAYMARDLKTYSRTCLLMGVAIPITSIPFVIFGFTARTMLPGMENPDMALPALAAQFAPLFAGIVGAGVFAAAMSTADSMLLTSSSVVVNDVYERYLKKDVSPRMSAVIGKYVVVILCIASFWFALAKPGLIVLLTTFSFNAVALFLWPTIGALFWPRGTKQAAIVSLVIGNILLWVFQLKLFGIPGSFFGLPGPLFANLVAGLSYFFVSLFTEKPSAETVSSYHGYVRKVLTGN